MSNGIGGLASGAAGQAITGYFSPAGFVEESDRTTLPLLSESPVLLKRSALPLDGMKGGLPEYLVLDWLENGAITIKRVEALFESFHRPWSGRTSIATRTSRR